MLVREEGLDSRAGEEKGSLKRGRELARLSRDGAPWLDGCDSRQHNKDNAALESLAKQVSPELYSTILPLKRCSHGGRYTLSPIHPRSAFFTP